MGKFYTLTHETKDNYDEPVYTTYQVEIDATPEECLLKIDVIAERLSIIREEGDELSIEEMVYFQVGL